MIAPVLLLTCAAKLCPASWSSALPFSLGLAEATAGGWVVDEATQMRPRGDHYCPEHRAETEKDDGSVPPGEGPFEVECLTCGSWVLADNRDDAEAEVEEHACEPEMRVRLRKPAGAAA